MARILSEKYSRDFGTVQDYLEITYEEEEAKKLLGQHVLAKPKIMDSLAYWGKIDSYQITSNIVSPLEYRLRLDDGKEIVIPKSDYELIIANPNQEYFSKSGKKVSFQKVEFKAGKFKKFHFTSNGKSISSKSIGISLNEFNKMKYWFLYKNGAIQPWVLKEVILGDTFQTSILVMEDENQNEYRFDGKELIIDFPPQIQMIKSKNWMVEKHFFSQLKTLNESFILYDKEDFDIGAPTKVVALSDDSLEILEGRTPKSIYPNKLDAIVLGYPFFILNLRGEMGLGSILSLKLFNRGIQSNYIGL
jgi:hypothetical protein